MENLERIAVLIDADNTQLSKLEAVLHELSTYGRIVVKKAFGNWKKPTLKNWEDTLKGMAIRAEQQFDYVSGKNTTDIAMVIDAMDLLHSDMYDAFALVSSDSDFTPLAIRLRESGAYVIGVGESKTPEAFKNACDDFILLEYISTSGVVPAPVQVAAPPPEAPAEPSAPPAAAPAAAPAAEEGAADLAEIHNLLKIASNKYQDPDGYTNVASAGQYIKRAKPDFTPLTYGYPKLPDLLAAFPKKYEMRRHKGKGTVKIIAYRCLG